MGSAMQDAAVDLIRPCLRLTRRRELETECERNAVYFLRSFRDEISAATDLSTDASFVGEFLKRAMNRRDADLEVLGDLSNAWESATVLALGSIELGKQILHDAFT